MADFLPQKDGALLTWALNASSKITATPAPFGVPTTMASAFAGFTSAFQSALAAVDNPATQTRVTVATKDQFRVNLKAYARKVSKVVQGHPTITNAQRIDLGLNVPEIPSPIPIPGVAPKMDVDTVLGKTVALRIHNADTTKRGRPAGCAGASVYSFIGDQPPENINLWVFEGNTTRTEFEVAFTGSVAPFAKVWLTALWFNPRQQAGHTRLYDKP